MSHLRGFSMKYLGPTDHKGARLKIKDLRHKGSWILARDYEVDPEFQALNWFADHVIEIVSTVRISEDEVIFLSHNFEQIKKENK